MLSGCPFILLQAKVCLFFCLVNFQNALYLLLSQTVFINSLLTMWVQNHLRVNFINLSHRLNVREVHHGRGVNEDINSRKTDTTSSSSVPRPRHSNIRFAVSESTRPGINVVRTNVNGTTTSKVILEDNEGESEAKDQLKRTDGEV